MVVPSAETDFVGDFRRKTYHLHFLHYMFNSTGCAWFVGLRHTLRVDKWHHCSVWIETSLGTASFVALCMS